MQFITLEASMADIGICRASLAAAWWGGEKEARVEYWKSVDELYNFFYFYKNASYPRCASRWLLYPTGLEWRFAHVR
jgi:hypothetical protein